MPTTGEPGRPSRLLPLRALGFSLALAAGWSATVQRDGATWFGVRGPHCLVGACLGPLACPGCGLLRATAAALQGHFTFAWSLHPAGPLVALLLLAGLALSLDALRRGQEPGIHGRLRRIGQRAFVTSLLLGWALRLFTPWIVPT